MNKWLNYHHLLYFRVIATEGSIAKASERLLVGQPALSSQLKNLEESLGQKLFDRKNRSLVLTEAGKIALEYANEIFEKGEEFLQVFNNDNIVGKNHIRIGVVDSVPKVLACDFAEFAKNYSDDCFISLVEGKPKELMSELNNHQVDIFLTSNKDAFVEEDDILISHIGEDKISAYGSKDFYYLKTNFPKSLDRQEMILPTKHSKLRYDLELYFHYNKIHYNLYAEVEDSSVKKLMSEHGKGIIYLPNFAAKPLVEAKKLYKIGELEDVSEGYWLVAKKKVIDTPLVDHILKNFNPMSK
ncbi:MAG: LysR family transcriptional regulator [Bacteriovoracaceae bacterium]|jgi:LysR family transcriptional activator of nhaA|nr:LysR family transcriptional regulator [Bacteriovoracaceae bacterium]